MKRYIILFTLCLSLIYHAAYSQIDSMFKYITIAQSLATSEAEALPAQFSVTWPKHEKASFLINLGVGIDAKALTTSNTFSYFTGEYHRNSLTDKEHNNIQVGYKGYYHFASNADEEIKYYLTYDPQFSRDFVEKKSSLQSNVLFTWINTGTGIRFGDDVPNKKKSFYSKIKFCQRDPESRCAKSG